ncbi:hypothetical protein QL285_020898 [Trifolium repens]|nr:hypothetical protein QL285_020898 [Trifolium repens]
MQKNLLRVWSSYATNSAFWRVSEVLRVQLKCQLQVRSRVVNRRNTSAPIY